MGATIRGELKQEFRCGLQHGPPYDEYCNSSRYSLILQLNPIGLLDAGIELVTLELWWVKGWPKGVI